MTFTQIGRGTSANDGTGDTPYAGAEKINQLIRAANAGQLSGFRNKLINGACQVWQRGTTFASGASQYTADRFKFRRGSNAAGATLSRQTGFSGAQYCARVARDSGNTATDVLYFVQQIESADCLALAGQTIRVSADIRAGANFSQAAGQISATLHTGTGTDESVSESAGFTTGNVSTTAAGQAITTTAARITFAAFTIPAGATEIALGLHYTPVGTAGAADYFEVTRIQIEVVNSSDLIATPFEVRQLATEIELCERFCQKSFAMATTPAQNVGNNTGEILYPAVAAGAVTQRSGRVSFRRLMRTTPTITLYNPAAANAQIRDVTAAGDCTASAVAGATPNGFQLSCTGNASTAVGNGLQVHYLATAEL